MRKLLTLGLFSAALAASAQQQSSIYVDMGTRGHDVSKSMYGMFFEEINHAGDGGLYGELLQNRGFEEHVLPGGMTLKDGRAYAPHALNYYGLDYVDSWVEWNVESKKMQGWAVTKSGCKVQSSVETPAAPLHENTPNALHLVITEATDGSQVNVINSGYWGIATKQDSTYKLRFYMKSADYAGDITAKLTDKAGNDIGQAVLTAAQADGEWHEYKATLTATKTQSDGKFRLELSGNGTVDLDYVSLFPTDTYKRRDNGLRRDIAEALEALRPNFLRWPGGCIVEGITLENRVKWKETLGDPMTRRGEFSLWGYRSTYGLGMHEFLQFCEDVGMDGMFVANVGMSCCLRNGDFVAPDDTEALAPYLQDIRDAIEYAIGDPATNEWAARRAEAGHPDPFPLKYVELGNENGTERYSKRYAYFYDTLKKEYPQITFINTLTWNEASMIDKTDMFDVHWYVTPDEFYDDATLFDTAPRGDYTIYAGEYAANNEVGSGNMDAALSEAVFIGGMERNSDFVTMASYAPLLTNVNQPNWSCNLLWFDTDRVMGRASYHVQKLYSENRPDYNVKTRLYSDGQTLYSFGRVGFGTWNTAAEFRNLKVTTLDGARTLYSDSFASQPDSWTEDGGSWTLTDEGNWRQTGTAQPALNILNAYDFSNCTVEVEAKKISGAEGFLLVFGGDNDKTRVHYRVNIGGWGNTKTAFEQCDGGTYAAVVSDYTPTTIKTGQWYKLKLVMKEGEGIKFYLDDELVSTYATGDLLNGRLQAYGGYDKAAGEIVVKVVNAKSEEMTGHIVVNGTNIQPEGKVITLAAESLSDENTLDNPTKIYPVESTFNGFADKFSYTFKPNSFTIFRIKADSTVATALDIPAYEYDDTPVKLDAAEKQRALATANLNALLATARRIAVEGATGLDALTAAMATGEKALAAEPTTTKAINDAAATLEKAIGKYVKGLKTSKNSYTDYMADANFSSGSNAGWSGDKPSLEHNVGEFFNCTFHTYQQLSGLKPGKYLLTVQGFYRQGPQSDALAAHNDGTEQLHAALYANDSVVALRSLYDHSFTYGSYNGYLDNREQSEKAFNESADNYVNYLIAEVGADGKLTLGLRKSVGVGSDWTCFNNFQLHYIPQSSTGIKAAKPARKRDGKNVFDLGGRPVAHPSQGLYIVDGQATAIGK